LIINDLRPITQLAYSGTVNPLGCRIGAHLSCKISPNWSEAADDPRGERDAIHGIKPNRVPRDEGYNTFGSTCLVSRCDQLVCHLLPARRTLSNVDFPVRCDLNAPDAVVR
jgi:hypothetical protein